LSVIGVRFAFASIKKKTSHDKSRVTFFMSFCRRKAPSLAAR